MLDDQRRRRRADADAGVDLRGRPVAADEEEDKCRSGEYRRAERIDFHIMLDLLNRVKLQFFE